MQRGFLNKPPKKNKSPLTDVKTCGPGPTKSSVDQKKSKSQHDLNVDEASATSKSNISGQNDQNKEQKKHVTFSPATNVPNKKKGGSSNSSSTTKMSSRTTTPVPLPVTPSPATNHPYVEIREMLDSDGNEIKSETIDLTKELKCLQNEIKQKTKEKQRQNKNDDNDDDDDNDEHEEGESKEEDLEEAKNNSGATTKSVQWQPDEKDHDKVLEEDVDPASSLGQPSQERYKEITSRLDQLALEEERYEKERAINEASSQTLQGTGWKKGFFDSKKKSTSTNKKKPQKQQQSMMKKALPPQNQQTTSSQQSTQQPSAKKEVNPVVTEEKKEEIIEKQSMEKGQVMPALAPAPEKATAQTERPTSSATVTAAKGGSGGILKPSKYNGAPSTSSTNGAMISKEEHANNVSDQHNKSQPSMAASSIFDGTVLERKELPVRSIEQTNVSALPNAVGQTQAQSSPSTEHSQNVQPTKKLSRFAQQRLEQQQRRR